MDADDRIFIREQVGRLERQYGRVVASVSWVGLWLFILVILNSRACQ